MQLRGHDPTPIALRALRAAIAALVAASGLLAVPLSVADPVAGVGPLPACRIDDILTEPRGYDDWEVTLVDWILTLGPKYRPPDLVSVSQAVAGGGLIREVAIDDLNAMADAARKNGTPIKALSPFRGYKQQVNLFYSYAGRDLSNFESAITYSARPGHSEHQTGLAIDFGSIGDTRLTSNWEVTPAGGWMAKNAWKYGWLMSYPDGEKDDVCYRYEPWHYRYVGREMAAEIHDSGLTIREYLWANHTQVDPACVALPAPEPKTPGEPRSCAFPAPSPTSVPSAVTPSPGPSPGPTGSGPPPPPSGLPTSTQAPQADASGTFIVGAVGFGILILLLLVGLAGWAGLRRRPGRR